MLTGVHTAVRGQYPYDDDQLPLYVDHLNSTALINGWEPVHWYTEVMMLSEDGGFVQAFVMVAICLPRGSMN